MVCRNEFKIKPGRIKDGKGTYCSSKCAAELRKTGEYRKCETCDKQFYLNKTDLNVDRGKYCSDKCRYANTGKSAYVLIVVQDFIVIQRSLPTVAENTAHNTVQTEVEKREFRRYVLVVTIHLV
jgi:hypothetical protein